MISRAFIKNYDYPVTTVLKQIAVRSVNVTSMSDAVSRKNYKAAKLPTEVTEDLIREAARPLGLVDIKVCAVDERWSGLKLVIRKENRI